MMSLAPIDSNTWYGVQSFASDYYLSWDRTAGSAPIDIDNTQDPWQFLDSGIAQGGSPSNQFLLRSQNGGNTYCMQVENDVLVLSNCSSPSTSALWAVVDSVLNGQEAWIVSSSNGPYIEAQDNNGPPSLVEDGPTTESGPGDFGWSLSSISEINDQAWSTLPWDTVSSNTGSAAATTILSPSPTSAATSTTQTGGGSSPTILTARPSTTPATITTPAVVVPTGGSAVPSGEFFNFSYIDVSLKDLGPLGNLAAKILLPPGVDIGCQNCSGSGYWSSQSGGYTPGDSEIENIISFLHEGFVNLTATDININMTLDYEMKKNYAPINTFLSFYHENLTSVHVSKEVRLDFILEIGIPFEVIVDSDIKFTAGMTLSIPGPANLNIDFADFSNSGQSGFENSDIALVPFRMDDPNLALTAISGLKFLLHCDVYANLEEVSMNGNMTFEIDLPRVNATAQLESSPVNSACGTPTGNEPTYSPAVEFTFAADFDILAQANLTIEVMDVSKTFHSDDWPAISYTKDFTPQCLFLNQLSDTSPSLRNANAAGRNEMPKRWIWFFLLTGSLISLL